METFEYIVDSESEGMRLDRYLKKTFKNESLSKIFQALRKGDVKINGKKSKENYRLCLGDKITVKYLYSEKEEKTKKTFDFDEKKYKNMIIFENNDFFIINKPGNVPMHKGTGHKHGLSEIFKKIYENDNINFANRLDYETSGLVIGCKNLKFLRYISEKIRNNEVQKKYVAAVDGEIEKDKFIIENYLKITENGVIQSYVSDKDAKRSITKYKKINNRFFDKILNNIKKEKVTLLDIDLVTGRKHQIRVQLSSIGNPVIGDRKYEKKKEENKLYLCCYSVSFDDYKFKLENENEYFK